MKKLHLHTWRQGQTFCFEGLRGMVVSAPEAELKGPQIVRTDQQDASRSQNKFKQCSLARDYEHLRMVQSMVSQHLRFLGYHFSSHISHCLPGILAAVFRSQPGNALHVLKYHFLSVTSIVITKFRGYQRNRHAIATDLKISFRYKSCKFYY